MFVKWNLLISLLFIIVAFVDILVPILSYNRRECCLSKCSFVTVSLHFSLIPFIEIVYYKLAVSYVHCMPSSGQSTHYWEFLPEQLKVSHTADIQFARHLQWSHCAVRDAVLLPNHPTRSYTHLFWLCLHQRLTCNIFLRLGAYISSF